MFDHWYSKVLASILGKEKKEKKSSCKYWGNNTVQHHMHMISSFTEKRQANQYNAQTNCLIVVPLLSHVQLFATPWTAAHKASLSFTISWSLLKLMFIESNYLVLFCSCLQFFPASGSFLMSQFQSIEASTSVLPMNIQD